MIPYHDCVNYSHPLTEQQIARIVEIIGETPRVRAIDSQIDRERPLTDVAVELADAAGLSPDEWQTIPLIINPPALAPLAVVMLTEIWPDRRVSSYAECSPGSRVDPHPL